MRLTHFWRSGKITDMALPYPRRGKAGPGPRSGLMTSGPVRVGVSRHAKQVSIVSNALTPRQQREREYYDQFSLRQTDLEVRFEPVLSQEKRPWNSYWRLCELVRDEYREGATLLDFGCGWGEYTVLFARIGYRVHGFDVSEGNVNAARQLARKYGLGDRIEVSVQTAERLPYPDRRFDVIAGVDILHHVDVPAAITECHRVLRSGGMAIFREPIYNPVFDTIRNWAPVRRLWPNQPSFDAHITADERKLSADDIATIRKIFPRCELEYSRVISRLAALLPSKLTRLEKVDYRLRGLVGMKHLSGYAILVLRKP
jgi:2-polyprenyl-3-methyl-5-hydroxy-6-metoxy-1,4-benzoquinol methylase